MFAAASDGGSAEWVGVQYTPFENLTKDPRIPRPTAIEKVQQLSTFVPNSPLMYSTYNGTLLGADFTRDASVTFASGLEAQYILAEAQGNNATNLSFLNSRRAIGGDAALVAPTDVDFKASVRDQRSRDLYLAAYRLGRTLFGATRSYITSIFGSTVPTRVLSRRHRPLEPPSAGRFRWPSTTAIRR